MTRYSLEIVPKQIERLKILPPKMFKDIYVAFIPGDNISNIIEASKLLKSQGFNPVPHCPARSILDENELDYQNLIYYQALKLNPCIPLFL